MNVDLPAATSRFEDLESLAAPALETMETNDPAESNYKTLAEFMVDFPECAIFRKFGALNILNLLRLQAELHDLEQKLKDIIEEDASSGEGLRMQYASNFRLMRECLENEQDQNDPMETDTTQYEMLLTIGAKLEEYNKALRHVLYLGKAIGPTGRATENLHVWFRRRKSFLAGIEASVWDAAYRDDHIAAHPQQEADIFTRLLQDKLLHLYHGWWGSRATDEKKAVDGFRLYQSSKLTRIGDGIVVALAAVLPTVAILILYFVNNMIHRIALVVVLTSLFAIAMATFTDANRVGIFSATAAFAAVEVVYIGSAALSN